MKKQIIFDNYSGFTTDLRRTLSVRFGIYAKYSDIMKDINGKVILNTDMNEEQYQKLMRWKNEMSKVQ